MLVRTLHWLSSSRLGRREAPLGSMWAVIGWWEARRVPFNLIVGATGVVTSSLMLLIAWAGERWLGIPIGLPDPPFLAVLGAIAFAVLANVCYAGGWIVELIVRKTWPADSERVGTISFSLGIVFAIVVTLIPVVIVGASATVVAIAQWLGYAGAFASGEG